MSEQQPRRRQTDPSDSTNAKTESEPSVTLTIDDDGFTVVLAHGLRAHTAMMAEQILRTFCEADARAAKADTCARHTYSTTVAYLPARPRRGRTHN